MQQKHLLDLETYTAEDITEILDTAEQFRQVLERPIPKVPVLRSKTVTNLFFENSTRTRISFELAEKRLSADVVNFSASGSSVAKGETLRDTAENILAMKVDMIVMRHPDSGAAHYLADRVPASVINAGDGMHEHPKQALLDAYTIREAKGTLEGLKVVLVGDLLHSRVFRSNLSLLKTMGSQVVVTGPPTLLPPHVGELGAEVAKTMDEAIEGAVVVMMLRVQKERLAGAFFPSVREYFNLFGLTRRRLRAAKRDALVMHPGPMNRGVEIASDVADGPHSVILEQVTNGVAVRMAVLYTLLVGKK